MVRYLIKRAISTSLAILLATMFSACRVGAIHVRPRWRFRGKLGRHYELDGW